MTTAFLISKPDCPFCTSAKVLLEMKSIPYNEKVIGVNFSKDELLELVPTARTVPQIFLNKDTPEEVYIGGFTQLDAYFKAD